MKRIAVFASGTGSNFDAIAEAVQRGDIKADIELLVCDKAHAKAIKKAAKRSIPVLVFNAKDYPNRSSYEKMILRELKYHHIDLIVLAGYMRLIGPTLLLAFPRRILNIHPSLLPKHRGLDAIGQAMNAGDTITGVTIHYVDAGMDTGEIIAQRQVDITGFTTREEIESAVHAIELELYPITIQKILEEMT